MIKKFFIFIFVIFPILVFYSLAIMNDYDTKKILRNSVISQTSIQEYVSKSFRYEAVHRVAIESFNRKILDCPTTVKVANKLISLNNRSAFAYYLKGACAEKEGDNLLTYKLIKKANLYQPIKLEYRQALVIANLQVGKIQESRILLTELLELYPGDPKLVELSDYISFKLSQS
jgi:tetratricopeptide (TPR) repeat protein